MSAGDKTSDGKDWGAVLARCPGPAFVVDVTSARFVIANAAAEHLWGATALAGTSVDRAMPALARLRQLTAEGLADDTHREVLVFWTARGAQRLTTTYHRPVPADPSTFLLELDAGAAAGGYLNGSGRAPQTTAPPPPSVQPDPPPRRFSALQQARAPEPTLEPKPATMTEQSSEPQRDETGSRTGTQPRPPAVPLSAELPQAAVTQIRAGDAETLKEIARRIREGRALQRAGESAAAVSGDPQPSERPAGAATGARHSPALASPEPSSAATAPPVPVSSEALRLARLAHELRTPISSIAALAEVMRDEHFGPLGDARYKGYAGDIHDSARHMLSVLQGMIDPAGEVRELPRLAMTEVDLADVIARSVRAMQPLAGRAGVRLAESVAPRLPRVIADKVSIKQILLNLVSNALRHTPVHGEVRVSAWHETDGRVRVEVADTGSGMSEQQVLAVFRPSAEPGRPGEPPPSSGYGLPLVRALVARNGAELAIESMPGEGSVVSVHFAEGRVIPV